MRPPRFRLRTLMIAVVVVAILTAGAALMRRSAAFRRLAAHHETRMASWMSIHAENANWAIDTANPARASQARWAVEEAWRAIEYHGSMRDKYERAARFPWLAVEPDPPEPE
jgi:hypothetical protein